MGGNQGLDLGYYLDMNTHVLSQTHILKHNPQGNRHANVGSLGGEGHEDPTPINGINTLQRDPREAALIFYPERMHEPCVRRRNSQELYLMALGAWVSRLPGL